MAGSASALTDWIESWAKRLAQEAIHFMDKNQRKKIENDERKGETKIMGAKNKDTNKGQERKEVDGDGSRNMMRALGQVTKI